MARSRRQDLLDAALEAFIVHGYEGTPVSAVVEAAGMSKAAFTYHFDTKESLLVELVTPLLDALDRVVEHTSDVGGSGEIRELLGRYLDALTDHRLVAIWIDGDKSVLNHPLVGARLTANNTRMRGLIAGTQRRDAQISAAAALGAMWRPIRNLTETNLAAHRAHVLDAAMAAAETARQT